MVGAQARMARAALQLGVRDVAALAKVSPNTITRIEAGLTSNSSTIAAVRAALECAGVIFVEGDGEGPGVKLRKSVAPSSEGGEFEIVFVDLRAGKSRK